MLSSRILDLAHTRDIETFLKLRGVVDLQWSLFRVLPIGTSFILSVQHRNLLLTREWIFSSGWTNALPSDVALCVLWESKFWVIHRGCFGLLYHWQYLNRTCWTCWSLETCHIQGWGSIMERWNTENRELAYCITSNFVINGLRCGNITPQLKSRPATEFSVVIRALSHSSLLKITLLAHMLDIVPNAWPITRVQAAPWTHSGKYHDTA